MKRGPGSLAESQLYVSEAMTIRLDALALEVAHVLDCEVRPSSSRRGPAWIPSRAVFMSITPIQGSR
jgi:hypothetical protein